MSGALVGLTAGVALLLIASWLRARRPLSLALRIGPYVGIPGTAARSTRRRLTITGRMPRALEARWVTDRSLDVRIRQAGMRPTAAAFRQRRLVFSAASGGAAMVLAALGGGGLGPCLVLAVLVGIGGWIACDWWLGRAIRRRRESVARQLPLLTDLVALAVSAGAGPVDALDAAARSLGEPIAGEVARATDAIRSGVTVDAALRSLARDVSLPSLDRFVDAMLVALETGSPLAEVARAQAADVRVDERRRLVELAGRRDVAMLVPIVFLVLPSVVLVAVYPGLQALRVVLP